jgi:3-hydroxypropanoate dehydrogenase
MSPLSDEALNRLFREARTFPAFLDRAVSDDMLHRIYNLARMGPTSTNSNPARFLFLRTPESRARLAPALSAGNLDKTMKAPVTAILAYDLEFYEHLPRLFSHVDARSWYIGKREHIVTTAFRNSTLQGAYFILAARALGLDCGAMSGFDNAKVDAEFFPDGKLRSNFLINIGYGDKRKLLPRHPRLEFEEACAIL